MISAVLSNGLGIDAGTALAGLQAFLARLQATDVGGDFDVIAADRPAQGMAVDVPNRLVIVDMSTLQQLVDSATLAGGAYFVRPVSVFSDARLDQIIGALATSGGGLVRSSLGAVTEVMGRTSTFITALQTGVPAPPAVAVPAPASGGLSNGAKIAIGASVGAVVLGTIVVVASRRRRSA
jgi:hypothetical protein